MVKWMFTTTPLSQRDILWKDFLLGNGTCTIGTDGCLLTCFTMLCQKMDVEQMNCLRINKGGYYGAMASTFDLLGGTTALKYIPHSSDGMRYTRIAFPETAKLKTHLDAGNPAIIEVNWYRRFRPLIWRWSYAMHYIVLMPNGQVYDPWPTPGETKSVCDLLEYGKDVGEAVVRAIYYEVIS